MVSANNTQVSILIHAMCIQPSIFYSMSMGLLVKEGAPIAWRGLMVMQAIQRLTRGVAWDPLDVLIIDTPPGTGDSMISLAQTLPLGGALIVTTPHTIAAQVVQRGASLLKTLGVPVVGIVRNMTGAVCPKCGSEVPLSTLKDAKDVFDLGVEVKIYCDIPTHPDIADAGDNGVPIVASNSEGSHGAAYRSLARSVMTYLDGKACEANSSDNVK